MEQKLNDRPGVSVDIALEKLHKSGIEMKRQGLTRYLRTGEILGYAPDPKYPKAGWTVDVESLQEFIDLKTMSVNDLRILVKKLREENRQLKAAGTEKQEKVVVELEEETAEGQLSIEDVESDMETLEIGRTDITKLKITTKEKKDLKDILFKDVAKNEKLKVQVPTGTTIEEFAKDKIKKPE